MEKNNRNVLSNPVNIGIQSTKEVEYSCTKKIKIDDDLIENVTAAAFSYELFSDIVSISRSDITDLGNDFYNSSLLEKAAELCSMTRAQIQLALAELNGLFTQNELTGLAASVLGYFVASDTLYFNKSTKGLLKIQVEDGETYDHISQFYEFDITQLLAKIDTLTEFQAFSIFMVGQFGLLQGIPVPPDEVI